MCYSLWYNAPTMLPATGRQHRGGCIIPDKSRISPLWHRCVRVAAGADVLCQSSCFRVALCTYRVMDAPLTLNFSLSILTFASPISSDWIYLSKSHHDSQSLATRNPAPQAVSSLSFSEIKQETALSFDCMLDFPKFL